MIIRLIGAVDEDMYKRVSKKLEYAEDVQQAIAITIELFSTGGDAHSALAIAARIRKSPLEVRITALGQVASAAVLILASGKVRRMTKEAWVMVHEDAGNHKGDIVALEREARQSRRMEDQWAALLEELTGTPAAKWTELHKVTTYLSAEECLALGLVDKII